MDTTNFGRPEGTGIIIWELAIAVVLMVVLLFFGGFIDIGREWFQMWRSTASLPYVMLAIATLV
jgi:predicted small integral membrane protein